MTITIPVVVLSLASVALASTGCGNAESTHAQTAAAVQRKLSDSYATSALLALKAIQRDPYIPEKDSNLVSRFTQEKIDAADVAAVSPEERGITSLLNAVYHKQLAVNYSKAKLKKDVAEWLPHSPQLSKKTNDALIGDFSDRRQANKDAEEQLNTCFTDLDTSLRARSTDVAASCTADSK